MVSAINSAITGLNNASQRLYTAATTIANEDSTQFRTVGTDRAIAYVPQQYVQANTPTATANTTAQSVTPATASTGTENTVGDGGGTTQYPQDITHALVQAKIASYDAQGNINVLKVQNSLTNSLLNIVS